MKVVFATDLHGSELCFRKFCAAAAFYRCEALIMGGDVTGKLLVPITSRDGHLSYRLGGVIRTVKSADAEAERTRLANMGYYPVIVDEDSAAELMDADAYEERLTAEAWERCRRWAAYADERLGPAGIPILIGPGNDDPFEIDSAFDGSTVFVNGENEAVELFGTAVATVGWSNPTPWQTPRECSEDQLEVRLRRAVARLRDPESAVFNFHVPPYDTQLDICPKLDDELRVVTVMGNPIPTHAGSTAVRKIIEEFQPRASLHGHIHESRANQTLGRTIALNPGSEYSEGVLQGVIVFIEPGKVRHTFTSG
jgi:Icc-related predicted phosphoesterase